MELKRCLNIENMRVVAFYPNTSLVLYTVLEQNHNYQTKDHDFLEKFGEEVRKLTKAIPSIRWDNKVVVALEINSPLQGVQPLTVYVGFKDGLIKLGLGVFQPDRYTEDSNQFFN